MRTFLAFTMVATLAYGSEQTNGTDGINSTVTGLTGAGIKIAQFEDRRPGKGGWDHPDFSATNTIPTLLRFGGSGNFEDRPENHENSQAGEGHVSSHATEVAGIMIGNSNAGAKFQGVAPEAQLYAWGADIEDDFNSSFTIDRLLNRDPNIWAVNLSWGRDANLIENMDGHSHISQYIDWAARKYDTVFTVSWGNTNSHLARTPQDNFNGITVAATTQDTSLEEFKFHWSYNSVYGKEQNDDRILIDMVAPGAFIDVLGNGNINSNIGESGTSYAAPQVAGAVALLQQRINQLQGSNAPNFHFLSRRHEVIKSVLLNSAAKIDGVNGAKFTLCLDHNTPCSDWRNSPAYVSRFTSLDPDVGAGQLNVEQAVKQLEAGYHGPSELIPLSGYDYGGSGGTTVYEFASQLSAGDWASITLVWDRIMIPSNGSTYGYGDQFDPWNVTSDNMPNLDLYLESRTTMVPITRGHSDTFNDNVEHLFVQITNTDDYQIRVVNRGGGDGGGSYALSWWIGSGGSPTGPPGDYNRNGSVGPEDYDVWKSNFGTSFADADGNGNGIVDTADYTIWRNNFTAGSGSGDVASVPEPNALWLAFADMTLLIAGRSGTLRSP